MPICTKPNLFLSYKDSFDGATSCIYPLLFNIPSTPNHKRRSAGWIDVFFLYLNPT